MKLVAIHKEKRNENYFFFVHKSYEFYKRNNSTENELQELQRKKCMLTMTTPAMEECNENANKMGNEWDGRTKNGQKKQ